MKLKIQIALIIACYALTVVFAAIGLRAVETPDDWNPHESGSIHAAIERTANKEAAKIVADAEMEEAEILLILKHLD